MNRLSLSILTGDDTKDPSVNLSVTFPDKESAVLFHAHLSSLCSKMALVKKEQALEYVPQRSGWPKLLPWTRSS